MTEANSPLQPANVGIAGSGTCSQGITVNSKGVGPFTDIRGGESSPVRDGIEGTWVERDVTFHALLLTPGKNTIVLTVPAGSVANGVCCDVIRLEVAPSKR